MTRVPINPRDNTACIPDGPVNRHTQVVLTLDPDTGQVFGEYDLDHARDQARNADGDLPKEQVRGRADGDVTRALPAHTSQEG